MKLQNPPYQSKIYTIQPEEFSPSVHVVACYLNTANHYLVMHRAKGTFQEHTWGVPAGKMEVGESPIDAVVRETREETGVQLNLKKLRQVGLLYIRLPHIDYTYHMFGYELENRPDVQLSHEHEECRWLTVDEILELPLISGGVEALEHFLTLSRQ